MAITNYHREIFDYLETYRKEHPEAKLTYALRQNNKPNRPRNLYIFTGNDKYIGIGLYKPNSNNNKTRTILFYANYDPVADSLKNCTLAIVFDDQQLLTQEAIYQQIIQQIGSEKFKEHRDKRFELRYQDADWQKNLYTYLHVHKPIIDRVIQQAGVTETFHITEESLEAGIEVANQPIPVEEAATAAISVDTDEKNFTWVPFYAELCAKLPQLSTEELVNTIKKVLKVQKLRGLIDRDKDHHPFDLIDVDPYTFLSFVGIGGTEKQLAVLTKLKGWFAITAPVPMGLSGMYFAQNQRVWLFGYSYERQPGDVDKLRELYQQVETDTVSPVLFDQVLQIKRLTPAKLSESLFKHRPERYFPINPQTIAWLKKRKLPTKFASLNEYTALLNAIQQVDSRPFYELVEEAANNVVSNENSFTWVPFYAEMCPKLIQYTSAQLISTIKQVMDPENQVGVNDQYPKGTIIELTDMDPYTFLSFINKLGDTKRVAVMTRLRDIMKLDAAAPTDAHGLPTAQAQQVWLFAYAYMRKPDDIDQLRTLYGQVEDDTLTDEQFGRVLEIRNVGKAKLTESLFYQKPERYLPINGQTIPWLKARGLPTEFKTYTEYIQLLHAVKQYDTRPFYVISRVAYEENIAPGKPTEKGTTNQINYWVFQGNPNQFKIVDSLKDNALQTWRVATHTQKIKPGDKIILWVTGKQPGCYALAQVDSEVYVGADETGEHYYQLTGTHKETTERVKITLLHNLWDRPVLKTQLQDLPAFADFKGGNQGTNFSATPEQYELIQNMAQPMPTAETNHPKNIILYGPPGTGKTYETIDLAVEIIDGSKNSDHKINKIRFDELRQAEQVEFVTFHQNYTYEDFVVGIKPDTDAGSLKFEPSYGVFYKLAEKARTNFVQSTSVSSLVQNLSFNEVFAEFVEPLIEKGIEIPVKMTSGIWFHLTDVSERSIEFRKANGSTIHTLSIATLKRIYEATQEIKPNGLKPYYKPLAAVLQEKGKHTVPAVSEIKRKCFVLIIDEINRANISRVFGELITLLEEDKRLGEDNELTVTLPNGEPFVVPPNLYIIGTMNTADKSLALLDIALRRRFEFIGKYPQPDLLESPAKELLERLNAKILEHKKSADFLIGHAYFMGKASVKEVMDKRIIPLLMEYFNGRTDLVKKVLGEADIPCTQNPHTYQLDYTDGATNQPG